MLEANWNLASTQSLVSSFNLPSISLKKLVKILCAAAFFALFSSVVDAKILVVAPHPDDDLLIAAGVTHAAIRRGEEIKVVFITNGDYSQQGELRQNEAVEAQTVHLGNNEDNLIFLGYPDGSLETVYQNYPLETDKYLNAQSGHIMTYAEHGLGRTDYHYYRFGSHAYYNRSNLLNDLKDIINTFRPDHIITVAHTEWHPDHRTTYVATYDAILAVTAANPSYVPTLNTMPIWSPGGDSWPLPGDPTSYFSEPRGLNGTGLVWENRESLDVPLEMQKTDSSNLKQRAINSHASQGGIGNFLGSFIHKDEFFWSFNLNGGNLPPIVSAGLDQAANQGALVSLDGSASMDQDSSFLSYQWRQISGTPVSMNNLSISRPSFTTPVGNPLPETLVFELRVSDGTFTTLPDHVSVYVNASSGTQYQNIAPLASVTASSENTQNHQEAIKAIDTIIDGAPNDPSKEWATLGEISGAWLQLNWGSPYIINRVVLHDRPNSNDQITSVALTFDNGVTVTSGALDNNGNGMEINVGPLTASGLRVTAITTSNSTSAVGLAEIKVYGTQQISGNLAPIANAGPDQSVNQGNLTTLNGSTSYDPEGATLSYSWSQIAGPSVTLSGANSVNPSFTAPSNLSSDITLTFALTVNDGTYSSAADWVSIQVPANPTINNGQNIAPLATVTASSQNADYDQLAIKTIDGVADGYPGDYTKEWATTGEREGAWLNLSFGSSYLINRIDLYDRPNQDDQITSATLTFSDGTTITTGSLDNNGDATSITFTPVLANNIKLTVTSVNPATQNIGLAEIKVYGESPTGNNQAPIANAGPDQSVNIGSAVYLDGRTSSDPNNDPITYNWSQTAGPVVSVTGASTATPSFTAPTSVSSPTVLTFKLIVNDGKIDSTPDYVNITVSPPLPQASLTPTSLDFGNQNVGSTSAIKEITLTNTGLVTLDITNISISNHFSLNHNCGNNLPNGTSCKLQVTFKPTISGNITGTVTLINNAGGTAGSTQTVALTGVGVNLAPIANAGPDKNADAGNIVLLDGSSSSDPNGDAITYQWTQTSGTSVTLSGASTATPSFTAPSVSGKTTLTFQLIVNDGKLNSPADTVNVVVNPLTPSAALTPTGTLNFGNQTAGTTSAPKTVTLTNSGQATLTISSIAVSGKFAQSNNCGSALAAGSSCAIQVTFKPTAAGTTTGTLTVTDNANGVSGSKQTLSLSGTGTVTIPTIPSSLRDNFNRTDATNLGSAWIQNISNSIATIRVNTNQAVANYQSLTGYAYLNSTGSSAQGAGFTFANSTISNAAIFLKSTGSLGTSSGQLNNAIRIRYSSGSITIATTTNGSASSPTYTSVGSSISTGGSLVAGNALLAAVDATGRVWVWKKVGTTTTLLTPIGVQLPSSTLWSTGGGSVGVQLPNGGRIDDFVAY